MRDENNKLMFPLCRQCAVDKSENCDHTDRERYLIGTWFSEELKLAVEKGYVVKEILQVLDWAEETSEEIFKPYIKEWLKLKTEASGWPQSCDNDNKKEEFIREFEEREGMYHNIN